MSERILSVDELVAEVKEEGERREAARKIESKVTRFGREIHNALMRGDFKGTRGFLEQISQETPYSVEGPIILEMQAAVNKLTRESSPESLARAREVVDFARVELGIGLTLGEEEEKRREESIRI